ncbi:MAG: hypothetical protein Q7T53_03980 [Deltaproteobacteria bacterium]|nr:hypothetical protein [Deltaproteobacteria bacterium]
MKKKTFKNAKALSLFLGIIHAGGFFWFSEFYLSESVFFIFFTASTGLALLVSPLVSDVLLGFTVVRMLVILLVSIGILNNLYMMYGDLTALYFPDIHAFIIRILVLYVLIIMLRRIINSKLV